MRFPPRFVASITREEFLRLLPAATGCEAIGEDGDVFRGPGWTIRLTPMAPLQIALVRLPRFEVEIAFDAWPQAEQDAFLDRFGAHFQRGGG